MWGLVSDFSVRFWGVRGSIACPEPALARYGGNTACVEVNCGGRVIVFDAGTGLRALGSALVGKGAPVDTDIFYSHCHIDHICGLPFFAPAFRRSSKLRLWAGNLLPAFGLEQTMRDFFSAPVFPDAFNTFRAAFEFHDFRAGDTLTLGPDITLRTAPLDHPGGSTGYRLEYRGRSLTYLTDTEHKPGELDANVLALARDADVMIYDGTFTDTEFPSRVGWGHSTWQQGAKLAEAARAKVLTLIHHDPGHDDAFLDGVAADVAAVRPGSVLAREGLTLSL